MPASSISVLIPAYNEEKVMESTVLELRDYLDSLESKKVVDSHEILICINGATDGTERIAERLARKHPAIRYFAIRTRGMGIALREGIRRASKDLTTFIAADGEVLNEFIERAIVALRDHDFVSGSRYLAGDHGRSSSGARHLLSAGFAFITRVFFSPAFTEVGAVKAFRTQWARGIMDKLESDDASLQTEMLYHALKSRLRVTEIPVHVVIKRKSSESKVRIGSQACTFLTVTLKYGLAWRWDRIKRLVGFRP